SVEQRTVQPSSSCAAEPARLRVAQGLPQGEVVVVDAPENGDPVHRKVHSLGGTRRRPIGSDSPNIWPCSSLLRSSTSSPPRTQSCGTFRPSSTDSTLLRWLSSTSRARWPERRASCDRQNAHAVVSLWWPGSKARTASSHASAVWR